MLRNLFVQLWEDESGAIVATEYLMLGSIVAMGAASGMAAMRDSMVEEYKEFGQSTRELRQSYSIPVQQSGNGAKAGGSNAINTPSHSNASGNSNAQGAGFGYPIP